jgi:hypothetical protein
MACAAFALLFDSAAMVVVVASVVAPVVTKDSQYLASILDRASEQAPGERR